MKKHVLHTLFACTIAVLAHSASAGNADAGAEKVAVCAACHGTDGNSPAAAFPKIAGLGEAYLLKQLEDIQAWDQAAAADKATVGRPVLEMTGMLAGLNNQDLADMAAFYAGQAMQITGSAEQQVRINSGVMVDGLALGEQLYRAGNHATGVPACTGCHSPSGQGNAPAGYPRLGGQYADYIVKQLKAFRGGERMNDGETMAMRLVAKNMSDAEITAVANYIAGLN